MAHNRIGATFRRLKRSGRKALIAYMTAGHPRLSALRELVKGLAANGVDLLEIGVPFSDPIADGPTIQASSQSALSRGVTLRWILSEIRALRQDVSIPLILMTYANPVHAMGVRRFFAEAAAAGVDGVICPDLIVEEAAAFFASAKACGVDLIYLVAPTTPMQRVHRLARASRGFLYAVSLTGVTGPRRSLPPQVTEFLDRVRRASPRPVAVGFGISTPEQARTLSRHADGVIVGSALIRAIERSARTRFAGAYRFVRLLRRSLDD